jgi:sugar lactone lactonase YvrE
MLHRSVRLLASLLLLAGCNRDLTLPPPPAPPGPGAVYGKVVVAQPGSADRLPVSGAVVEVLSTGLTTRSSVTGDFFLSGLTATQGTLLVRWDSTGTGTADRQRAIDLATVGVGPGRQISLGEIAVVENARVHGVALRGDVGAGGGHGGTVVFVPEGPFTTYTNDDGTFTMRDLPAGALRVEFFRAGYRTVVLDAIELRGGEDLGLRSLTMVPDGGAPSPPPGSIGGRVVLSPPATSGTTTVTAVDSTSTPFTGTVDATGNLAVAGLPPGLYQVIVAHDGYVPAMAPNALVLSARETTLPDVQLSAGSSGGGGACVAGVPCQPADLCRVGRVDCAGGGQVCTSVGNAFDGTPCGSGQACLAGACEPLCVGGASCQPVDPCRLGTLTCTAGSTPACTASVLLAQDGTVCGAGHVCHLGACQPCLSFAACSPPNPCHTGVTVCNTGVQICADTSATLSDGTSCGLGFFCHAGTCTACSAGALCTPANDCHAGITDCATGAGACSDTGSALANGTPCVSQPTGVCHNGACATCVAGGACVPGTDPCQLGAISCASGVPACRPAGTRPELSACSTVAVPDGVCRAGFCGPKGNTIGVPVGLAGVVGSPVTGVLVTVTDQASLPVAGANVIISPVGDGSVSPASALTSGAGVAGPFTIRLGRALGYQAFTVTATAAPVAATLTIRADSPSAGIITTVANAAHTPGYVDGPALDARLYNPIGLAASRDGSLYFTDYNNWVVRKISAAGVVTTIAGNNTSTGSADNVPATSSSIVYPSFLALDDVNHLLYVSESYTQRVRRVNLVSGIIDTVAGGGSAPAPDYGDGGLATSAALSGPRWIGLAPDGSLYVADTGHSRFRRVDLAIPSRPGATGNISTVLTAGGCSGPAAFYTCSGGTCGLAWDGLGNVFLGGGICGTDGTGYTSGVLRWTADAAGRPTGPAVRVAGLAGGATQDGIDARLASIATDPLMAFDPAGNLYLSIPSENRVRRVDAATFEIRTVAGAGASGSTGDGGLATSALLAQPQAIAFDPSTDAGGAPLRPTDLLLIDYASHDLRVVSAAGNAITSTATLTLAGGDGEKPRVDESSTDATYAPPPPNAGLGQSLTVTLTDATGAGLGGRWVGFAALDPSSLVQATLVSTDPWGTARVPARAGLKPIGYGFRASAVDLHGRHLTGSPVSFTWTARPPATGEIFSAVGADHTGGDGSGPGRVARAWEPVGLAVASSGDVYYAERTAWRIKRLRPDGLVEVVAGTGSSTGCGSADGVVALEASVVYPSALLLDEAAGRLYFTDDYCHLVRYVDLSVTPNRVRLVAGGGTTYTDPYGDGADPAAATFSSPSQLGLSGGSLYVADTSHGRVRRIDLATGAVSTFLKSGGCVPANPAHLYDCGDDRGCQVAVDSAGSMLVSGRFCGVGFANYSSGVAVVTGTNPDGSVASLTPLAGNSGGSPGEGTVASSALFANSPSLYPAPDGTLWLLETHRLRYLPASSPGVPGGPSASIFTWAGTTVAGSAGEYALRSSAAPQLNTPFAVHGYPGGHLILTDRNNHSLRIIW